MRHDKGIRLIKGNSIQFNSIVSCAHVLVSLRRIFKLPVFFLAALGGRVVVQIPRQLLMIGFEFVVRRPAIKLSSKKQVIGKNKFNKLNFNNGYCNYETFHFFNIHILKHINIGHIIIYHESFNFKTVSSIIKYIKMFIYLRKNVSY